MEGGAAGGAGDLRAAAQGVPGASAVLEALEPWSLPEDMHQGRPEARALPEGAHQEAPEIRVKLRVCLALLEGCRRLRSTGGGKTED